MATESGTKKVTIIVNGREREVERGKITFWEVVKLAFENPNPGPNIVFTVTYRRGQSPKPQGTMVEGDEVQVTDGMIFDVTRTDKS